MIMNKNMMSMIMIVILSLSISIECQKPKIIFGASVHSLSDFYFDVLSTPSVVTSYKFFEYWVNNNLNLVIKGIEYDFEFKIYDDDRTGVKENYEKLVYEDGAHVLINVGSIESAQTTAEVSHESGIPALVITPQPDVHINKTTVFNIFLNPYSQLYDILPLLRISGVKSVHILEMTNSTKACYYLDEIFEMNFINDTITTVYSEHDEDFHSAIDKIIELDKDLLLYCDMNQTNFNELTRILDERKYAPRAGLNLMLDKYLMNTTWSNYWIMYERMLNDIPYPPTKYLKTYDNVKKELELFFKEYPEYKIDLVQWRDNIITILSKLELALNAIIDVDSLDKYDIVGSIRRSKYDSLIGEISFTSDNTQLISGIGYQIVNGTKKNILIPYRLSNAQIIYPAPTYDERVKDTSIKAIEIATYVFVPIMIIISVIWIIFIIINRELDIIKSSAPLFLVGMLIGSIILYISIILFSPTLNNTGMCISSTWLLSIGFTLLFGSLLVKTWRIHVIFSNKSLAVFKVSNMHVLIFLSLLLGIDIVLLIIWTSISKTKSIEIIEDIYRISKNYNSCSSNTSGVVLLWIIIGYKCLMIIYAGYLALRVRTIPLKLYDESKIIAFCIYNVGLVSIVIIILQATSPTGRYAIYGINAFLIMVSIASTINSMMISKFTNMKKAATSTSSSRSTSLKSITSQNKSELGTISHQQYIVEAEKKIEKLQKENNKLRKTIELLKNANDIAEGRKKNGNESS